MAVRSVPTSIPPFVAPGSAPGVPNPTPAQPRSRWSGSAWAIARAGGGNALLSPQLGGSQAGARIAYALDDGDRTALFGRVATPLGRGPAEVALGAQWRPTRAPITLYAEARASDGRIAPAAGLFGGVTKDLGDVRLDGYGQVGVIARDGTSVFGDGQLRLTRRIGPVEVGGGIWAAAQRGANRLDVGPSVAVPIHVAPVAMRLTLDWRQRIAGNARPASGPALSLGADF